ncbi:MAG TPA: S41 family peptidase, partial [Pyrinomonadaceae bacterium]|nr:S41 family peptidase [Pyrinomonadaceae bacterium]
MSFRTKFILTLLSATLTLYTAVGGWISTRAQQPANDPNAQLRIFESVLQHIQNDYVDEPNMDKVRAGALRGLAYGLDPYSTYLTSDQVKEYNAGNKENVVGIGAELSQVASYLYIIAPMKGSAADQAGLKAGDIIEYIDNKATRDISLYDAKGLLNGAAGSEVKLRVLRANSSPLTISVKRGAARAAAAETRMEAGKVGILRINSFADGESTEIKNRLQDLVKQGAQKIVIDMRDTAGGSLAEAVNVANLFIKDGVLAQTIGREGKALKTFSADPKATLFTGPVVALIDNGTAGAAEVVASAITERNRGQIVGEKSFGAGTEQQLFSLRGGDGLLLTTVKWASSTGKTFLGEDRAHSGVTPNVEVKGQEVTEAVDPDELTG